jgi:hypothetical protein
MSPISSARFYLASYLQLALWATNIAADFIGSNPEFLS